MRPACGHRVLALASVHHSFLPKPMAPSARWNHNLPRLPSQANRIHWPETPRPGRATQVWPSELRSHRIIDQQRYRYDSDARNRASPLVARVPRIVIESTPTVRSHYPVRLSATPIWPSFSRHTNAASPRSRKCVVRTIACRSSVLQMSANGHQSLRAAGSRPFLGSSKSSNRG